MSNMKIISIIDHENQQQNARLQYELELAAINQITWINNLRDEINGKLEQLQRRIEKLEEGGLPYTSA